VSHFCSIVVTVVHPVKFSVKGKFVHITTLLPLLVLQIFETIPKVYQEELLGISDASGLGIEEVTIYNIFYELFTFCTSIIIQNKQGEIYHGRNLDFGLFLG